MADKLDVFKKRELRRSLRKGQTKVERFLWFALRNKRTGYKFYRQLESVWQDIVNHCKEREKTLPKD